jgi:hypothetical protein
MCEFAKLYHIQIPEAFAGPLGAMPVIKTSPLAVIPIVGGMHVQVSCMHACTRHPDCAHIYMNASEWDVPKEMPMPTLSDCDTCAPGMGCR